MSVIRNGGFEGVIKKYVSEGKIIYTGSSAGSMVVARDLTLSKYDQEELEYIDVEKFKNFSGMNLVNFLILPHCGNKDFVESNIAMVEKMPDVDQPLLFIYDNQAVFVEDDSFKIVSI